MKDLSDLTIITAGGTIDAFEYDYQKERVVSFRENPVVLKILQNCIPGLEWTLTDKPEEAPGSTIYCLPPKDSSQMTDADRERIANLCLTSPNPNILITHGTDTMIETGLAILHKLRECKMEEHKMVALTGSLPYSTHTQLATFNIASALETVRGNLLRAGVFIAMYGRVIPVEWARKVRGEKFTYFSHLISKDQDF